MNDASRKIECLFFNSSKKESAVVIFSVDVVNLRTKLCLASGGQFTCSN